MNFSIPLNDGWLCTYFETESAPYEFATDDTVVTLTQWSFDKRRAEGWMAWLQRSFRLDPTDFCVRYLLLIDSAPQKASIYVNDQHVADYNIGDDDPPFELNVTYYVALEDNTIAFRVSCDAMGQFARVRLQAIPCDDLPD